MRVHHGKDESLSREDVGKRTCRSDKGPECKGAPPPTPTVPQAEAVTVDAGDVPRSASECKKTSPGAEGDGAPTPAQTFFSHKPAFGGRQLFGALQQPMLQRQEREERRLQHKSGRRRQEEEHRWQDDECRRQWQLEEEERRWQEYTEEPK